MEAVMDTTERPLGADTGQLWTRLQALCCVSISHLPSAHTWSNSLLEQELTQEPALNSQTWPMTELTC